MKIKWWWYLLPFVLLQLPFAFSPMCLWDSAVQQHLYTSGNFECAKKLFYDSGVPLSYYELAGIAGFSNFLVLFKLVSVLIFFLSSLITARILQKLNTFSSFEIYFISVGTFFYPCYAMWQHVIMFPYYVSLFAFSLAVLSYLRFDESRKAAHAVLSAFLLIVAFNIQSFLVYEIALISLFFFFKNMKKENLFQSAVSFLKANWIFLVLPFTYYIFVNHFFPRAGIYKEDGYNMVTFNLASTGGEMAKSIVNTTITPARAAIEYFRTDWISAFIYLGLALLITFIIARKMIWDTPAKFSIKIFLIAGVLVFFTLLPYALVGKHVSTHGYETRHSLLAHTPLLILIIIAFRLFGKYQKTLAWSFITFCFFAFLKTSVHWENRYNKQEAIISELQKPKAEPLGDIVFFTEKNHVWAMEEYLRFYECNMILNDAFHDQQRLGINDERAEQTEALAQTYIDKYLKYKDCLFFNSFKGVSKISEAEITEKPEDDAIIFLNSLFIADKKAYYAHYIDVHIK